MNLLSLNFDEDYFTSKGMSNYRNYPHFRDRAIWIKNNLSGSILEIGCAFGFFIAELKKLGIIAYGIDSSTYALSQVPLEIVTQVSLLDILDLETHYDWIISWNVLDCLQSEAHALQRAQILKTYANNQLHVIQTDGSEDYTKQGYFIRDYDYWRILLPNASIIEQMGFVHSSFNFSKIPLSFGSVSL